MLVTQCDYVFDKDAIIDEVLSIVDDYGEYGNRLSLTHSNKTAGETLIVRMLEAFNHTPLHENIFDIFDEQYTGSHLHDMFNQVPNIGRFRIMIMNPMSCYNLHVDPTKRYHFVIETNKSNFFVFPEDNESCHIPCDGNMYLIDTTKPHTFVNCGDTRRIHLVLSEFNI